MKSATALGVGLVAAVLTGCASMVFNAPKWNGEQTAKIRTRAAFEMSCAEGTLKLTELDKDKDGAVKTLGVEGCDKKATYIHVRGWGSDAVWAIQTTQNPP